MEEYVVLVDAHDRQIGVGEKMASHREGLRHRAFSVILLNGSNILLQRRSRKKYHSAGLWANAACGHPRPDESLPAAAHRRLAEEMGIRCDLTWRAVTHYEANVGKEMIENEIVHLFLATIPARQTRTLTKRTTGAGTDWKLFVSRSNPQTVTATG